MTGRRPPARVRSGLPGAVEGGRDARGLRFGIAVSRFNEGITDRLLKAAVDVLRSAGVESRHVVSIRVPGAFELPLAAKLLCRGAQCDAVMCLGAIIRGDTPHFDYIAQAVARGIMDVGLEMERPVVFGVLTTDTVEQAEARADAGGLNRGAEAAETAIEMATLARRLRAGGKQRSSVTLDGE